MTHVLRVTDGVTTLTFTSVTSPSPNYMYLGEYNPETSGDPGSPIKEKATVGFFNSTSDIQTNLHTLQRLFYQAGNYARNRSGNKVYIEFDPGGSGSTAYRSLLYSGAVHPPRDMLGTLWAAAHMEFEIEWTRDPFWEGALTQVPLANTSATATSSAIEVNNTFDAASDNTVTIVAADVLGDLPAPIKVQMENTLNDAETVDEIFIFHNVHSTPASFQHIYEAEDSEYATTLTPHSATADSDGNYGTLAWAPTTLTKIAEWSLTSAQLSYAAGGRFAILARFHGVFPYDNCWLRFQLETQTNNDVVWQGNLTLASTSASTTELVMLDTLRLPPQLTGISADIGQLQLVLYGARTAGTNSIDLDYIELAPISGDSGWLRFKSVARGIAYGEKFIHDAIEGFNYRIDSASTDIGEFSQYGGPLLLFPNADQKLYFSTHNYSGVAPPLQTWGVKLWYRPRRTSI